MSTTSSSPREIELTPESINFLKMFTRKDDAPLPKPDPAAARQFSEVISRHTGGPYISVPCVEDIPIPTLDNPSHESFLIRVYWPYNKTTTSTSTTAASSSPLPVVVYAHGGGFSIGSIGSVDQMCRQIVNQAKIALVSVNYRLSPEYKFPSHLNDVEAAYRWVCEHPEDFNLSQIFISGDSAGGNLTAALSVRLSTLPLPRPLAQLLIYPAIDLTCSSPSYQQFAKGYGLDMAAIQDMINDYLGPDRAQLEAQPEVSPLLAPDPSIFPPTLLISAEADILVGDAYALKSKLEAAGVEVEHVVFKGLLHGFIVMCDTFPEASQAVRRLTGYIQKKLNG